VLVAMADELERTRSLGLRVESAVCAAAATSAADVSVICELQQFDLILQRVAALRDFALALSRDCAPDAAVALASALARVTLEDVRERLAGAQDDGTPEDGWEFL
jgi:hypothetical protein